MHFGHCRWKIRIPLYHCKVILHETSSNELPINRAFNPISPVLIITVSTQGRSPVIKQRFFKKKNVFRVISFVNSVSHCWAVPCSHSIVTHGHIHRRHF